MVEVRRRDSIEAFVGGATGSPRRPQDLLLGRCDSTGRLRLVGKTATLDPGPAGDVAGRFTASWTAAPP